MTEPTKTVFETWPGYGRGVRTQSGGTRNTVRLSRPWQIPIPVSGKCPFCTKNEANLSFYPEEGGWRVLGNPITPHLFHRLVIPQKCWPIENLYTLGGDREKIEVPLRAILDIHHSQNDAPMIFGVHIGCLAGQNTSHLHYHVVDQPPGSETGLSLAEKLRSVYSQNKSLVWAESPSFIVSAGGEYTGQSFIIPKQKKFQNDAFLSEELASLLFEIVLSYHLRFRSAEGLPPEFFVSFRIAGGEIACGAYVPILSHRGFVQLYGTLTGDPIILQWPHKVTAAHLRGEKPTQ